MAKKRPLPRSMTGFGSARREAKGLVVDVEVRAVNHRFLQIKSRVPHEIASLEPDIEAMIRSRLGRGSVSLRVDLVGERSRGGVLNSDLAGHYAADLKRLVRELDLEDGIDLHTLVGLPGVVATPSGPAPEQVWPPLKAALIEALDRLDAMRLAEGKALLQDMTTRTGRLGKLLGKVRRRAPVALRGAQSRIRSRVRELIGSLAKDKLPGEIDLDREMALLADRADISEELTRFESHLEQWESISAAGGQVGKRLEFLLQEMGREVNTIGSKAGDVQISHLVVELKAELEKQREQIQNLE